ncbi:MAG: MmgE/PrpD family protein [Butyrivibrio sp.]|nr:MmgE/PrpD family protein [Butyrivibrio sp.]
MANSIKEFDHYTKVVSQYIDNLSYDELPGDIIEQVKIITLHTLAAGISSFSTDQAKKIIGFVETKGGRGEATVWGGSGKKVPSEEAVLANGTMADILDWEDCAWTGHPSAGAVPVALAESEALGRSGREFIEAVTAAYEIYTRVAMSMQPTRESIFEKKMMWGLVSWQIISAQVASAKLRKLSLDKLQQSFGAAYYQTIAPGIKHSVGTATSDIYHYAHGFCARNGVTAVKIADLGFDNLYDALDDWNGLWNTVSDNVDWDWIDRNLGGEYLIKETLLKHWPANVWNQGPVDTIARLVEDNEFSVEEIESIAISPNVGSKMTGYHKTTRKILDAQFSIPYCVCVYLLDRDPRNWFTEEMRNNEKLIELTKKVVGSGREYTTRELFELFQSGSFPEVKISISLRDGKEISTILQFPKGHPKNPYTLEEETEHFRFISDDVLGPEKTQLIIDKITHLEEIGDMGELAVLLSDKEVQA